MFDVLAVAHEDVLVEAEGGCRCALAVVAGHGEDFADVLDTVPAGVRGHDGGRWPRSGRPAGERVAGAGVFGGGDVVQPGVLGEGVAADAGFGGCLLEGFAGAEVVLLEPGWWDWPGAGPPGQQGGAGRGEGVAHDAFGAQGQPGDLGHGQVLVVVEVLEAGGVEDVVSGVRGEGVPVWFGHG